MFIGTYPTVQFFVEDPQGRRTGLDPETDEVYSEIPGATYGPEYLANVEKADAEASPTQYTFEIFQPLDGAYTIRIGGSAEGKYTAYFFGYDEEETPSTAINVGQLSDGYPHTYLVYYSKDVGRQIDVKRVDQTYLPLVIFQD